MASNSEICLLSPECCDWRCVPPPPPSKGKFPKEPFLKCTRVTKNTSLTQQFSRNLIQTKFTLSLAETFAALCVLGEQGVSTAGVHVHCTDKLPAQEHRHNVTPRPTHWNPQGCMEKSKPYWIFKLCASLLCQLSILGIILLLFIQLQENALNQVS